jgi:hypothetical protein
MTLDIVVFFVLLALIGYAGGHILNEWWHVEKKR